MVPFRPFPRLALACLLLLSACASPPTAQLPKVLPTAWRGNAAAVSSAEAPAPDLQSWWKTFHDPVLDRLVERALAENLGLAQASSRLRQARLLSGRDRSQYLPSVSAVVQTVQDVSAVDSYFHAGLDATWELGLFGARASVDRGADARLALAAAGAQAARVSVVGEVVRRYLELKAARHNEALLQQMVAIDDRLLKLHGLRERLRVGAIDERRAVELRQAQTRALLASPRQLAAQAEQALAVLLGQTAPDPAWGGAAASLPALQPFRLQQVPADLLRFRPDIRSAESEVDKAVGELGVARAELYPRVALGFSFLYAYNITQNRRNVNGTVPAIGPMIDIPLFDWGRRRAAADAREEALNASLLAYRQVLLEAVGEAESALAVLAQANEHELQMAAVQDLTERGLALQTTRVRLGLASDIERLEAQRSGLQAGVELADAKAARGIAFVALYKSLGGAPLDPAEADTLPGAAKVATHAKAAP